jgi:hypothetical protein
MSALMPAQMSGHAERAAEMAAAITVRCNYDGSMAELESGHDWVQVAQVHAALAVSDALRDLIGQVAELTAGLAEARDALADGLAEIPEALAAEARDLADEVSNLATLIDCTPVQPARRPWRRRPRACAGSES